MNEDVRKMDLAESIMWSGIKYWDNKVSNKLFDRDDLIQEFRLKLLTSFPKFKHLPDDEFKTVLNSVFNNKARGIINWSKVRPDTSNFTKLEDTIQGNANDMMDSLMSKDFIGKFMDFINKTDKITERYKNLFNSYVNMSNMKLDQWEKLQEEKPQYREHSTPPFFTFAKMLGFHPLKTNRILKRLRGFNEIKAIKSGVGVRETLGKFNFKIRNLGGANYYSKIVERKIVIKKKTTIEKEMIVISPRSNNSGLNDFFDNIIVYNFSKSKRRKKNSRKIFSGSLADYVYNGKINEVC